MRTGILAVVALMTGGVALADEPSPQPVPQQVIEDLSELRQELGQSTSTPAEFAQAVQNIAEGHGQQGDSLDLRPTATAWAGDGAQRPTQNPWDAPPSVHRPTYAAPAGNAGWNNMPQMQTGPAIAANPYAPGPPPHHAKPGPRPPKVLLQDTAFDLERMAHELDKAELYGEADALREAATRLRMTARQQKKPDGRPQPPVAERPGPAPVEHPHAAERARRAIREAEERVRQMERQVAVLEQQVDEANQRHHRQVNEFSQKLYAERLRIRQEMAAQQRAPEGSQRPRERRRERPDRQDRDRPDLPPPGVHGGPTDPPPPPELAPGQ